MAVISVDRDFARFGEKSYAINKINTVEVRARKPYGQGGFAVAAFVTGILIVIGLGGLADPNRTGSIICFLIAAFFGWIAYRALQRSKTVEYQLFLMTSSSEAQAFTSQDADEVYDLRNQIEAAMMGR